VTSETRISVRGKRQRNHTVDGLNPQAASIRRGGLREADARSMLRRCDFTSSQLVTWPVAVEKLTHQKMAEKTLHQEALPTTFRFSYTFSILRISAVLRNVDFFNSHAWFRQLPRLPFRARPSKTNRIGYTWPISVGCHEWSKSDSSFRPL
jgi:hypothetical protein